MAHDRDRDHPPPAETPPKEPELVSRNKPDRIRAENPTPTPREPLDPRSHPSRRARIEARPV